MRFSSREEHRSWLVGQSVLPCGFSAASVELDFVASENGRPYSMDLSLLVLDEATDIFAGMFTRNALCGAPVEIARRRCGGDHIRAVLINNKVANVYAAGGEEAAERLCARVGRLLRCSSDAVIPASTGIIGWRLPENEMSGVLPSLVDGLDSESLLSVAEGMMTTDLYPKVRSCTLEGGRIVGVAKGAGMIEPNLGTMLVFILTDLDVPRDELEKPFSSVVAETFNAISIDSDESTSDMAIVMSSKAVPCSDVGRFADGLRGVCCALAKDIVRNGEGTGHLIQVLVSEAASSEMAKDVGKSVVNSPLVKCAVAGNDPNVGRLLMAVGKYFGSLGTSCDLSKLGIDLGAKRVFANGKFDLNPECEEELSDYMKARELNEYEAQAGGGFERAVDYPRHEDAVEIHISLGLGRSSFTVWGSDLTHGYISENADYRS